MRSRCEESWRLFWRLCDLYRETVDQVQSPRDWSRYHQAVAAYREHYETCPECLGNPPVPSDSLFFPRV